MESKELTRAINAHLFVPIEETLAEQLHEVTILLTSDVDTDMIENYTRAFFKNEADWSFKRLIDQKYEEQYGKALSLPGIVYIVLEVYFVRQCIQSDTVDAGLKLQFSYIVKNFAVLRKGSCEGVVCPDWIINMYQYSDSHACKLANSSVSYSQIINTVLPCCNWAQTGLDINNQEIFNQLRSLSAAGIRGRLNGYVESNAFKGLNNPFAQVYKLVVKMVKEWNWKYISSNPVEKLRNVMGDDCKKRKKLSNIVDAIREDIKDSDIIKPTMKSSVLLKKIHDNINCGIEGGSFSVLEFGTYLYYELLLETNND